MPCLPVARSTARFAQTPPPPPLVNHSLGPHLRKSASSERAKLPLRSPARAHHLEDRARHQPATCADRPPPCVRAKLCCARKSIRKTKLHIRKGREGRGRASLGRTLPHGRQFVAAAAVGAHATRQRSISGFTRRAPNCVPQRPGPAETQWPVAWRLGVKRPHLARQCATCNKSQAHLPARGAQRRQAGCAPIRLRA